MATKKTPAVSELRKMTPPQRRKAFDKMSRDEMLAVTVPCTGEAHLPEVAGQIDHCGVCINTYWGRQLKRV